MSDLLADFYPWIKSLHIMAVIAWMAGLFYLPRLFVYHAEKAGTKGDIHDLLGTMEFKLIKVIMNPAMIATWVFGLCLVLTPGVVDWSMVWPWTKGAAVIAMTGFHMWLGQQRKSLAAGTNALTGRQFRMMNEVPTVLMIVIVLSVVIKF
ncbi:MAG: protoporphyrinogen oxidase HemJ [Sulfitobacter sp.]